MEIGIAIGIGIEMVLGHEKLDVYRLSIGYVAQKADSAKVNWTALLQCLADWAAGVIA